MSRAGVSSNTPAEYSGHLIPLANLSAVQMRMDSLHRFLSQSIDCNAPVNRHQMESVSSEIATAIQDIIANGTALLAESPDLKPAEPNLQAVKKEEEYDVADGGDFEIVELDAVELLAEHFHFCEICGKGFRRDANLRMHMRAHGNQFKTAEALTKPVKTDSTGSDRTIRFSCPHAGCNRNKAHKKFRPLKSAICAKNHFKRSHCPKMYSCNRCEKKRFSVLADLKSHLRSCGTARWRCSCGTTFSRKDKLFGHVALFDGHMPAVVGDDDGGEGRGKSVSAAGDDEEEDRIFRDGDFDPNCEDDGVFEGLLDGFGSIDNFSLHDVLGI